MEHIPEPSECGSVVLDIGGDVGAVIVVAPASLAGEEIEIRRHGAPWDGTHVAVRARHLPNGVMHAALFESLPAGDFEVRIKGGHSYGPPVALEVEGGRVVSARLPGTRPV
jgi:hypothetical protein